MIPFRVYNREQQQMWQIINFHPQSDSYLATKEDETESDGQIQLIHVNEMLKFKFIDFIEENESHMD